MMTGINFDYIRPAAGSQAQKPLSARPEAARQARQNYDQLEISGRPMEIEQKIRNLAGRLAQEIRTRPSSGELAELRTKIRDGNYRPDPGRIAAGILLISKEDI